MNTRTLYITKPTAQRIERIRQALGGDPPLSRIVAHAAALAVRRLIESPAQRPWELDASSSGGAERRTIYLAGDTTDRLEDARGLLIRQDNVVGRVPTMSVVVARALALAEPDLLALTREDIDLLRIEAEAEALDVELEQYAEAWGEAAIQELLERMRQNADLVARAGRVHRRATAARVAPRPFPAAYVASSDLMLGPLMRQSQRIIELITQARNETDRLV